MDLPVVMLSEGLWRETFHADPNIVGQVVKVGGKPDDGGGRDAGELPLSRRAWAPDLKKGVWLPIQPTPEMLKDRGLSLFQRGRGDAAGRDAWRSCSRR